MLHTKRKGAVRGAFRAILSILLILMLTVSMFPTVSLAGNAVKDEKSRDIAIVFDNSGSMYGTGNKRWCQAIYAMEVFAAMMNDGDTLSVYPMNDIEVNGTLYTSQSPLVVRNLNEVPQIENILTIHGGITPVETVTDAYNGLLGSKADEQWLIVLTDGTEFYQQSINLGVTRTQTLLSEVLTEYNQTVNVMYLGIGVNENIKPTVSGSHYSRVEAVLDTSQVPSVLADMANSIFGRDQLVTNGNSFSIDIAMKRLIVFVQGKDIDNIVLRDSTGKEFTNMISEYSPHYSTLGALSHPSSPYDEALQGTIKTFADCPSEDYTVEYTGEMSSIAVFYEPDVDLVFRLVDANGNTVSTYGDQYYAGTYKLQYGLVDREGNFTNSPLLGETNYSLACTLNGEETVYTATGTGEIDIELAANDTLDLSVTATYLGDYTITRSGQELGLPVGGVTITPRPAGSLMMTVSGGADTYTLAEMEEKGVYDITFTRDGNKLTADELKRTELDVSVEGGVDYEIVEAADGYQLCLRHQGAPEDTNLEECVVTIVGTYTNEDGEKAVSDPVQITFELEDEAYKLRLNLDVPKKFLVISALAKAEPMKATITMGGQPLTAEQFALAQLNVNADGLKYIVTPLPEESAYEIAIDPNSKPSAGVYKLDFTATALDPVGREVSADADTKLELQHYPLWLRILLICLVIAVLAFLIWMYLNAKVLPKKIAVAKTIFTVDGQMVTGTADCKYAGGGKKRGSLDITSPRYSSNPLVRCGFRVELEAISPRREKSSSRGAGFRSVQGINASAVNSINLGPAQFAKESNSSKFVKLGAGAKNGQTQVLRLSNNARCNISGEVTDSDGGATSISLIVVLKFY